MKLRNGRASSPKGWWGALLALAAVALVAAVFLRGGGLAGVGAGVTVLIVAVFVRLMFDPPPLRTDDVVLSDPEDLAGRWREIQNNRYNPGYWTGGKIDPVITALRPNRHGYVELASGALTLFLAAAVGAPVPLRFVLGLLGFISITAGIKLLLKPAPPKAGSVGTRLAGLGNSLPQLRHPASRRERRRTRDI